MREFYVCGRSRFPISRSLCTLTLLLLPAGSSSASSPVCQSPKTGTAISLLGSSTSSAEIHMEAVPPHAGIAEGSVHLDLRNDGLAQIDQLCVRSLLSDNKDVPRGAKLAVLEAGQGYSSSLEFVDSPYCFRLQQVWNASEERSFAIYIRASQSSIPLSGSIYAETTVSSQEKSVPESSATPKVPGRSSASSQPSATPEPCITSSKPMARTVILLPSRNPWWLYLPLLSALIAGLSYLEFSYFKLRCEKDTLLGGPQWSFGTSFATNFTVGTGLLTLLLGGTVTTDALHYMTKLNYTVLGVLFAALLLLAPAIFAFFSSPQPSSSQSGEDAVAFVGKLGLFLTTAAFMVGAVIGQLVTVGLAVAEIQFRGYINDPTMTGFLALLLAAVVGTLLYAYKSARSYLDQMQPEEDTRRDVESILAKVASGHRLERFDWNSAPELTSPEKKTLDHLVKKHGPTIPKWNMF